MYLYFAVYLGIHLREYIHLQYLVSSSGMTLCAALSDKAGARITDEVSLLVPSIAAGSCGDLRCVILYWCD